MPFQSLYKPAFRQANRSQKQWCRVLSARLKQPKTALHVAPLPRSDNNFTLHFRRLMISRLRSEEFVAKSEAPSQK
jgi:hypothetical protein